MTAGTSILLTGLNGDNSYQITVSSCGYDILVYDSVLG